MKIIACDCFWNILKNIIVTRLLWARSNYPVRSLYLRLLRIATLFFPLIILGALAGPFTVSSAVHSSSLAKSSVESDSLPRESPTGSSQLTNPPVGVYFDHVVLIMMENEGISNICGGNPPPCSGSYSPYMSSLANTYGVGSQYLGLFHVSLPNYVGLIGASIDGCTNSGCPLMTGSNIIDRLESVGLTWRGYMESQTSAAGCDQTGHEPYEPDHNPFIHFQDIMNNTARCNKVVLANPTSCGIATDCTLINNLNNASAPAPNLMWLTPNDCNNMRSTYSTRCTNGCVNPGNACITAGDNYLKSLIPNVLNSRTFTTTRSALFITFDEGIGYCPLNNSAEDCLYAVWAGSGVRTGFVRSTLYNHYSVTKTLEVNWNLPSLTSNDANATPMTEFFKTPPPDITLSASPSSLTVLAGVTSNSTITLTSVNNFTGIVTLSSSTSPTGMTGFLNPASITLSRGGTATSSLSVSSATAGNYTETVNATSGSISHSANVTVIVQDYRISASPTSLQLNAGASAISTITATPMNHFAGTLSLSAEGSSGLTISISPQSIPGGSGTATLTVRALAWGNYTVRLNSNSDGLPHNVTVRVQVVDFAITANPTSIIVETGTMGPSTITITSLNHFTETIALSDSVPSGLICATLSPGSITGGSGSATISCTANMVGNYALIVTGSNGALAHSVGITIRVTDFGIAGNPASVIVLVGSNSTSTITLSSQGGYSGTVTLIVANISSPTAQGAGPSSSGRLLHMAPFSSVPGVTINPAIINLGPGGQGQSVLNVTLSQNVSPGNYTVTVTAKDGSLSHSIYITIVATDFRFTYQPAPVTLTPGGSTSITIWLQGFNSFQGTMNLTVQSPLGGPQGVLNSSTVNVNSTGPSGVGLTIDAPSTTPTGNYTMTVVASWRGIPRVLTITISVRPAGPAGITAAFSYRMNHESLAEAALAGLVSLASSLAIMSRSKMGRQHRVSGSWVFQRTHVSSGPSFRQQDLVWLMRRA